MSGIKINFDTANNPIPPLIVLGKKNGHKINGLVYESLITSDSLNSAPEFTCVSHKMINGRMNSLWDDIRNFRTVWIKEWDTWFDIEVDVKENDVAVVELSSFQLISMRKSPDIAVVTNLAPNHLDVHKDMQEYIDSKKNIYYHLKGL